MCQDHKKNKWWRRNKGNTGLVFRIKSIFSLSFSCWLCTWGHDYTNAFLFFISILFDVFLPIVHTKLPENPDEIGGVLKRFWKWSVLKRHRFENVLFLVWTCENRGLWKWWQKRAIYCHFHHRFQVINFGVDNRQKHMVRYMNWFFEWWRKSVYRGNENGVGFFEIKMETFQNAFI